MTDSAACRESGGLLKSARTVIGVLISLLCLWLAVRHVPISDLRSVLAEARYSWLALALFTQFLSVLSRAQLWVALLDNEPRFIDAFWSESIGYLFTNILPLRMGDPARVLVMSQRSGLSLARVAGSAVVERVFDVFTILLALVAVFPFMSVPGRVEEAGVVFALLVFGALAAMFFFITFTSRTERMIRYFCTRIPRLPVERVLELWREMLLGLSLLSNRRIALKSLCWEIITWGLNACTYYCTMRGFQSNAGIVEAVFMLVVLCLAVSIPSSPGFVGVFQWAGQQALVLPFAGKYDLSTALAITLTAHAIYYIMTSSLGVAGLFRQNISFANLRKRLACRGSSPAL